MYDEEIDVIGAEPLQRRVDRLHDVLARQAFLVWPLSHRIEDLGREHHLVAPGEFLDRAAGDLLAHPLRIDVRRIEKIDAGFEGGLEKGLALGFFQHPLAPFLRAVGHAAKAKARNLEAGRAEADILHVRVSCSRAASVPIPKFVSPCGTLSYELRNQRDTSNSIIL